MKKLFLIPSAALSVLGTVSAFAQDAAAATETVVAETQIAGDSMHHVMMQKFLEGGWEWMLPVLLCLVIGLAVAIERILYLSLSTINSKKLIASVEEALKNGGIEAAKEVCRNTRGPIASIYSANQPITAAKMLSSAKITAACAGGTYFCAQARRSCAQVKMTASQTTPKTRLRSSAVGVSVQPTAGAQKCATAVPASAKSATSAI